MWGLNFKEQEAIKRAREGSTNKKVPVGPRGQKEQRAAHSLVLTAWAQGSAQDLTWGMEPLRLHLSHLQNEDKMLTSLVS